LILRKKHNLVPFIKNRNKMDNTSHNLFVYGSLRSGFKNPAYEYLARYFTYSGEGLVHGKFYDNGSHPVGIASANGEMIVGELYTLNNADEFSWAFEQLDDYEGLHIEAGETALYKRTIAHVYQEEKIIPAWIYWFNGNIDNLTPIASGDLMEYVQQKK
jgi:gamma-glutamylcyclotransferase (GGCT)/AIG2-like uncharacterized protein YtfP